MEKNARIKEHFIYNETIDLSRLNCIGKIETITANMEISFEMKIENIDSCKSDEPYWVLAIGGWFYLKMKKSTAESNCYYISIEQRNGFHRKFGVIRLTIPISVSNYWKKECLEKNFKLNHLKQKRSFQEICIDTCQKYQRRIR